MKMGDESVEQVEVIPTGSIGLNAVSYTHLDVYKRQQYASLQDLQSDRLPS